MNEEEEKKKKKKVEACAVIVRILLFELCFSFSKYDFNMLLYVPYTMEMLCL